MANFPNAPPPIILKSLTKLKIKKKNNFQLNVSNPTKVAFRKARVHGKTKNKIWLSVYTRTQTLRFPPQFHSQIHAQLKHFC